MKLAIRGRIAILATILIMMSLVTFCFAGIPSESSSGSLDSTLKTFLYSWDKEATNFLVVFKDLNDDGLPEAIVYLTGSEWCGSGGCRTLILSQERGSWKIVTEISIVRLPIRILKKKSHGWHSLGVWVQGGGIRQGYEAELNFNGKTYPTNPTVPPARRLNREPAGEVVLPVATK